MLFSEFEVKNGVNVKQIDASSHAIKRAKERFTGWENYNDSQVLGNLRKMLKTSTYAGEVVDEQRKTSHMFVSEKKAIYLSEDLKDINTVMYHSQVSYTPLKRVLLDLHRKEIRKLTRKEKARLKKLDILKDDCSIELAILNRRMKRTRSESVKNQCMIRTKAIEQTLNEYESEIIEIQNEKRVITRSLASII